MFPGILPGLAQLYTGVKNAVNPSFDLPFIQNPYTNNNQGKIPILQSSFPQSQGAPAPRKPTANVSQSGSGSGAPSGVYYGGGSGGGGGGSGGGAAPAYDPQQLAMYDQAIGVANNALGRLPNQLGIAQSNIGHQFDQNNNQLDSSKNQAQASYGTSTNQNQQNFRTNKNTIADQASAGLHGLLRMLGAYGAGGSSDARYVAPQAVAGEASQQRAGAGQTFAQNQSGLDTNWHNFETGFDNSKRQLNDWRTQQLQGAEASSATTKQDLLSKLADLVGKRAAYQGGSYTGAAQPYVDQAQALAGRIDELGRLNPTYTGTAPVYTAPTLSSYQTGPGTAPTAQSALQDTTSPFLSMLLGQQRDKNLFGQA